MNMFSIQEVLQEIQSSDDNLVFSKEEIAADILPTKTLQFCIKNNDHYSSIKPFFVIIIVTQRILHAK